MTKPLSTASISDVAKRARVSRSTVSLVLNEKGNISAGTRRRVLKVCDDLRYHPHPAARFLPRLRKGRASPVETDLFCFTTVIAPGERATYADFLDGVARVAVERRKMIIYQPIELGAMHPGLLLSRFGLDGRVVIGHVDDRVLDLFQPEGVPMVVIGNHECEQPVWNVHVDCSAAGKLAVDHLWKLGHRRIAFFGQARPVGYQTEFLHGFEDELARKGLRPGDYLFVKNEGPDTPMDCLFHEKDRPTAVVAIEGGALEHTILRAREARLEVPRDLSVLVFGQRSFAAPVSSVTWIDPVSEEVGRLAMELAIGLVGKGEQRPARTLLQPRLVEGETCRAI